MWTEIKHPVRPTFFDGGTITPSGTYTHAPISPSPIQWPPVEAQVERLAYFITFGPSGTLPAEEATAVMSHEEIEQQIGHYEQMFGMSSEAFIEQVRAGTAPDTFETMDWMILLRHR
jgi:hypothetical protein